MLTEKASDLKDQVKVLPKHFDNISHMIFNDITESIIDKLHEAVPELVIKKIGKTISDTGGSISLSGTKMVTNENEYKDIKDKVRHTIDGLKNSGLFNG